MLMSRIMEANVCDVNHLDSDVLLPPRKRLLACLKRQNSDANGNSNGNGNGNSSSPSTSSFSSELDSRLNNFLRAHLSSDNPSQEEIVEASRSAAEDAVRIAVAARAAAQEKAVIAANAMAAAKKALELVATIDEQETSSSTEEQSKKNKMKKHVQVQMLYNNKKPRVGNGKTTDEELARKLHQAINSSPRISKCGSPSELKSHKHKKLKSLSIPENDRGNNGSIAGEGSLPSTSNGNSITREKGAYIGKVDENTTKFNKADMGNADAERIQSKVNFREDDSSSLGRKRGRMKQKKLPLSICHDRDQTNPKEDQRSRSSELVEDNMVKTAAANDKPLFSVGPSANSVMPAERTSLWKCQAFKAPTCVKQNKVMQS